MNSGYFTNKIFKLANKFSIKLAAKIKEENVFRGEMNEDLDELLQAIHEKLAIFYKRMNAAEDIPKEIKTNITSIILQTSKLLKEGRLLRFDFNRETIVLDNIESNIKLLIHIVSFNNSKQPNYNPYNHPPPSELVSLLEDILGDLTQIEHEFGKQFEGNDRGIIDPTMPIALKERVHRNINDISPEDVSPDFPGFGNDYED